MGDIEGYTCQCTEDWTGDNCTGIYNTHVSEWILVLYRYLQC